MLKYMQNETKTCNKNDLFLTLKPFAEKGKASKRGGFKAFR